MRGCYSSDELENKLKQYICGRVSFTKEPNWEIFKNPEKENIRYAIWLEEIRVYNETRMGYISRETANRAKTHLRCLIVWMLKPILLERNLAKEIALMATESLLPKYSMHCTVVPLCMFAFERCEPHIIRELQRALPFSEHGIGNIIYNEWMQCPIKSGNNNDLIELFLRERKEKLDELVLDCIEKGRRFPAFVHKLGWEFDGLYIKKKEKKEKKPTKGRMQKVEARYNVRR